MSDRKNILNGILDDEDKFLISKICDLAEKTLKNSVTAFSDFLNPRQQNMVMQRISKNFDIVINSYGGFDDAERKIFSFSRFCNNDGENIIYPIDVISIKTKDGKVFSHRDYLGSVLSLGIKREKIGDVVISNEVAYLFCESAISDYIILNLTKVKNSYVILEKAIADDIEIKRNFKITRASVSSMRLDCVVCAATGKSRSAGEQIISSGLCTVNYETIKSSSFIVKDGDVISIRKFGKMIVEINDSKTKKGRQNIVIKCYV